MLTELLYFQINNKNKYVKIIDLFTVIYMKRIIIKK